jgi:hypothetical protein
MAVVKMMVTWTNLSHSEYGDSVFLSSGSDAAWETED